MTKHIRSLRLQSAAPFLALCVLFAVMTATSPSFLSSTNLFNVLRQAAVNGVIAVGMLYVILTGGIDLSVGSVAALSGMIAARMSGSNPLLAISLPLLAGAAVGMINSLLVNGVRMQPFVATLSTMMGVRGLSHVMTSASSIGVDRTSEALMYLSKGRLLGVFPVPTAIMLLLYLAVALHLKYTRLGRGFYAVGGNEEAAVMMGVRVRRVKGAAYVLSGVFAAFAGLLLTARLGTALPVAGQGFELTAIATIVLGGTYLSGGRGNVPGTLWAALTMALLSNMFNMHKSISTWIENILMGILLIAIVLLQSPRVRGRLLRLAARAVPIRRQEGR